MRDSPRLFGELELPGVPLTLLAIALGVSAAVCFFLARYLASPVDRLNARTLKLVRLERPAHELEHSSVDVEEQPTWPSRRMRAAAWCRCRRRES